MKETKFLQAMSEIDCKYIEEALNYKQNRMAQKIKWLKWGVTAACISIFCLGAGTVLNAIFSQIMSDINHSSSGEHLYNAFTSSKRANDIPIGNYNAVYEKIPISNNEDMAQKAGDLVPGTDSWYYVLNHTDMQYLIRNEDGEYSRWRFICFDSEEYPYRDVLELVYQIDSADQFEKIESTAANLDNTPTGNAIQQEIGTYTVTDRTEIQTIYDIISSMICYGDNKRDLIDQYGVGDEGLWLGRHLKFITSSGLIINRLYYTGVSDMFYEYYGIAYKRLSEEQAESISEILQIKLGTLEN